MAGRTDEPASPCSWSTATPPASTRRRLPTVDLTRKQARIEFSATPGRCSGRRRGRRSTGVLDLAAAPLAAEQVGGAQRCLDMTVAHARRRVQFGRPIGTFQAVQHRCADMLLEVESARSASAWATHAAADQSPTSSPRPRPRPR